MHVRDLDPYTYIEGFVVAGVQAVGWLARGERFPSGSLSANLVQRLADVASHPVNQSRGFHRCEFCGRRQVAVATSRGKRVLLGSAELWLPGRLTMFASPNLIVHYIEAHGYLPPKEYLEALECVDVENWKPSRDYCWDLLQAQYPSVREDAYEDDA